MKKLMLIGLFLFSGSIIAGGTITLQNKTGMPLEIFNKSNSPFEYESGGPILQNNDTYRLVGPKASSYYFGVRPLNQSSHFIIEVQYGFYKQGSWKRAYRLQELSRSNLPNAPGICWSITKTQKDHDGPHDFTGEILNGLSCIHLL